MIISHSRPTTFWTPSNAAFVTDPSRLTNGRPTATTRLLATSSFTLTASFGGGELIPQLAGFVNVSLPVGTAVTCDYKRSTDGGFGYQTQTQTVVQDPDGSKSVWFGHPEGLDAVTDVRFAVTLSGVGTFGTYIDIGEVWLGAGGHYCIKPTYAEGVEEYSIQQLSISGQPYPVERANARTHNVEVIPFNYDRAFVAQGNFGALIAALTGYKTCAIVPITSTMFDGKLAIDPTFVNRHGALCFASEIGGRVVENKAFDLSFVFTEMPRVA